MAETIFAKILRGEIPCHRVYEDDHVLAFLDIGPLSRGHTLVIPKEPAETLDKLSDESAAAIGRVLPRIARAVHWNMLAPLMDRVVRDLRDDITGPDGASVKKTS